MSVRKATTKDFPAAVKVTSPLGTTIEATLTDREFRKVCVLLQKFFVLSESDRVGVARRPQPSHPAREEKI